jgi:predicted rRNA methylase YqxC with S4 and FtsJ domains
METKKVIEKQPQYRKIQGLIGESSFSIVLPKSYAMDLGISKGGFVKVYCIDNRIIIEKAL